MVCTRLLLSLLFVWTVLAPGAFNISIRSSDFVQSLIRSPFVRVHARYGLSPCQCDGNVFNCTDRLLTRINGYQCSGATNVDISGNLLSRFPDGLQSATSVSASRNWMTAMPTVEQLNPGIISLDFASNIIETPTSLLSFGSLENLRLNWNKGIGTLWFLPNPCALKIIEVAHTELQSLEGSLTECRHLEKLDVQYNELTSLPPNIFSSLTKLRNLLLSENPLGSLSPQLFSNLTQLQILSLDSTRISALPLHIFDSLTQLESLDLSRNSLETLPSGIFSRLTRLSTLQLASNKFQTLPVNAFLGLQALEELNLLSNKLQTIPDNAFLSLSNLKELHLMGNMIETVGTNLFSNTTHLEAISLDNITISSFPPEVFAGNSDLKTAFVQCVSNNSDLLKLSNVKTVIIDNCEEVHLQSRAYAALSSAVALIVDYGIVRTIANDTLDGLTNLKLLAFVFNDITELPSSFYSYTPNIEIVIISRNNLTSVPETLFSGLYHIKDIILNYNNIIQLPENVFQGLSTLERVDLSYNELSSLPDGIFNNLPAMYELSLKGNKITTLPLFQANWPPFKQVSLLENKITEFPPGALLSWLASDSERYVYLMDKEEGFGVSPEALYLLQHEPGVTVGRAAISECRSWMVRKGAALVFLNLNVTCPPGLNEASVTLEDLQRAAGANSTLSNDHAP